MFRECFSTVGKEERELFCFEVYPQSGFEARQRSKEQKFPRITLWHQLHARRPNLSPLARDIGLNRRTVKFDVVLFHLTLKGLIATMPDRKKCATQIEQTSRSFRDVETPTFQTKKRRLSGNTRNRHGSGPCGLNVTKPASRSFPQCERWKQQRRRRRTVDGLYSRI